MPSYVYVKVYSRKACFTRMKCNERDAETSASFLLHACAERPNKLSPFLLISLVSFETVFSKAVKKTFY